MIYRIIFFFFLCISTTIFSQKKEAQAHVAALTNIEMFGRGYVNNGHTIAANYLANEFSNYNLTPIFENNFFQEFQIDVNTFPTKIEITFDGEKLIAGKDYLLDPQSGSASGTYSLFKFNIDSISNYLDKQHDLPLKTAIVIDVSTIKSIDTLSMLNELKYELAKLFPVIWLNNEKFTWSVSSNELANPIIQMRPLNLENQQKIYLNIKNQFLNDLTTKNVIGKIPGRKEKFIVFSAHYDHLGMMGSAVFPGANDNASGTSMLLSLAKYYAKKKPKYNMLFIGFGAEEVGIKGSYNFVNNPPIEMDEIKMVINLDIVGTGSDGIAIVNAIEQEQKVKKLISINSSNKLFKKVKIRGQAPNSDHYWFSQKGIPAIFIYTLGGVKAYHDIYDIHETLPLDKYNDLFTLLIKLVKKL
tara:strand:+ start:228 stop:1469 length:1242 start_codon:yes stop_codon:yes gene_type:complete